MSTENNTDNVEKIEETEIEEGKVEKTNSLDDVTDAETLKEMVRKLRKENADTRTKKNSEHEEFLKWKASQQTELERAQDRIKNLEKYEVEARKRAAAKEASLDPDFAEFITGTTEEEMLDSAKRLAEKTTVKKTSNTNKHGSSGTSVTNKKTTGGSFLLGL